MVKSSPKKKCSTRRSSKTRVSESAKPSLVCCPTTAGLESNDLSFDSFFTLSILFLLRFFTEQRIRRVSDAQNAVRSTRKSRRDGGVRTSFEMSVGRDAAASCPPSRPAGPDELETTRMGEGTAAEDCGATVGRRPRDKTSSLVRTGHGECDGRVIFLPWTAGSRQRARRCKQSARRGTPYGSRGGGATSDHRTTF